MLKLNDSPLQQSALKHLRTISDDPVDGEILYCLQLMQEAHEQSTVNIAGKGLSESDIRMNGNVDEAIPVLMGQDQTMVLRKILGIWESEEPGLVQKLEKASTPEEAGEIFLTMIRTTLA